MYMNMGYNFYAFSSAQEKQREWKNILISIFVKQLVMPKAKVGQSQRLDLGHTSGAHYGVQDAVEKVVAFELCRPHEIPKVMHVTSIETLIAVHIYNLFSFGIGGIVKMGSQQGRN